MDGRHAALRAPRKMVPDQDRPSSSVELHYAITDE